MCTVHCIQYVKLNHTFLLIVRINRARLQARMNATTHEFLTQFTPRLENLFRGDLSLTYLQQMDDHLQLFYNDVLGELETKQTNMQRKIDGK